MFNYSIKHFPCIYFILKCLVVHFLWLTFCFCNFRYFRERVYLISDYISIDLIVNEVSKVLFFLLILKILFKELFFDKKLLYNKLLFVFVKNSR